MSSQTKIGFAIHNVPCSDIDGFDALVELALNLRWSWNHATDGVWRELDPKLWAITNNPWIVLLTASRNHIKQVLSNPVYRKEIDSLVQDRRQALEAPAWFQINHAQSPLKNVAYFRMEFMLSEALPIYSGGLGNVAGDQLKANSDLGIPVVGVGLLYQRGYFRQLIDKDGNQQALYPYNDPGQLPIAPLRQPNGEWLRLEIALPGYSVWLRAWQVQVGRLKLYLLDSNDVANFPAHRGITSELYGGDSELRLKQEMILGIGGWRLLTALGIQPEVCHLNEGHAALAVLERARSFMLESGQSFEVALAVTRAGNVFTTHTAVPAGFDRFAPELIQQYLGWYCRDELGISVQQLLALGRKNPEDTAEPFNMAYLAIHGSGAVNGVSQLHGKVSRELFQPLFPRWPEEEVPVGSITNGVHMPTWDSAHADEIWTTACGKDRWLGMTRTIEVDIRSVSDRELWQLRVAASKSLVEYARHRLSRQLAASGASADEVEAASHLFDPNALTLGFARRFATYKRPDLLLHDPQRLIRLLSNSDRPIQLMIAGKAHPNDRAGQDLIRRWVQFIRQPECRSHAVFLCDYDMLLTENLVQGVDVWLNTPQRPWEACGTSGMKVLVNGGLNLSELDGWWAEAYAPDLGWAIGDGQQHGDDPNWDSIEADALYTLLENEVIPQFYQRDKDGIPTAWVSRMRESLARLTPYYSADRTVRAYTEDRYLPAAADYLARAANNGDLGRRIVDWHNDIERNLHQLRFGEFKVDTHDQLHRFEIQIDLCNLNPESVRVELYATGVNGGPATHVEMRATEETPGETPYTIYVLEVPASSPSADYTVRIIPNFPGVAIPLEESGIRWQR